MTFSTFDPPHKEMGRHIAAGVFNSGIVQSVRVLCQIASVIVLSRLLTPSDFGLLAMVGPICGFIALFQDLGLSQATVQKPNLTHEEVNVFFWINMAVSATLAAIIVAISPLIGWYYHEPRLVPLSAAMGILLLGGSSGNLHSAILTRRMQFGLLAITGVIGGVGGLAVSIIFALILRDHNGYWALYYGMIAGTFLPVAGVWITCRWRPSRPRRVPGLSHMLKFGVGVTASNMAGYISGNVDNVLIGHRWGDHPLGLYDRAYKLLLFPLQRIVGPVSATLIPVLSRLIDEPEWYRGIFLKTLAQLALAIWPGIIWSIVLDKTLIPTLLGPQWVGAAPIFVPLSLAGLVHVFSWASGCLFISQGRAGELARWGIFSTAITVTGFVIGLPYGPVGVATSFAITSYMLMPLFLWYVTRRGPIGLTDFIGAVLPQAFSTAFSTLALIIYRRSVDASPVVFLAGGLVVSYATAAVSMGLSPRGRETLRLTIKAARKIAAHAMGKR